MRALAALLAALSVTPLASSQAPTDAWVSVSVGPAVAQQAGPDNEFYTAAAVQVARMPWAVRVGFAELDRFRYDLTGILSLAQTGPAAHAEVSNEAFPFDPDHYQSLTLGVGPASQTDRFSGAILAGPAVTWGQDRSDEWSGFARLGVSLAGQAGVRLLGPLWVGAEATAVVNSGASHLGAGATMRVDLARPVR